jgi:molecular chaperone GrpE (heat shock protein)
VIGKIITAAAILALVSVGAISVYAQGNDRDINNTNITIAELAQNVTGNVTVVPLGNLTLANMTSQEANQNQNQTQSFQGLENSTAILNAQIETSEESTNQTDRAQIKTAISDALKELGNVANRLDTATSEQMRTLQTTVETISDAIEESFND